jgi:hypothetical protein
MPNWTEEWLTKRSEKPAAKPQTERAPDPQAAAKRQEKRWSNILQGIDECEAFLLDAVSQGLLAMHSTRSWDQMAARMVDAQAPGIARRLKRVGSMIGVGSDWGERAAAELGTLTLAIEAARRIESLPLELQWDAKAALGIPVREDELPIEGDVADMWSVLGQSVEVEDRITTFRSWLYGMGTGKWAMHLAFSVAGQAPGLRLIPGQSFAGIGRFYPSAWPLRASFSEMSACEFKMPRGWTWEHSNERLTDALSKSPWIESLPVLISDARLGRAGDMWYAIDESDGAFPMSDHAAKRWLLLALTGNGPASLFGEWDGRRFSLLSSCAEWGFIAL